MKASEHRSEQTGGDKKATNNKFSKDVPTGLAKKPSPWVIQIEQWQQIISSSAFVKIRQANMCDYFHMKNFVPSVSVTVKHVVKVMVWECMSATDVGWLQFVEGIMNDAKYITKLETRMLPSTKEMFLEGDFVFQDDNLPCHRAKVVQNWFAVCHIMLLQCPRKSPGLAC